MFEKVGFEQATRTIRAAFEFAILIVNSARAMTPREMGFPRLDGKPHDKRYEQFSGYRREESTAIGRVILYFMMSAELSKLKAVSVEVWSQLDSVEHGHARAYRFARDVASRVRDSLHLEDPRFPATVSRPNTKEHWQAAARVVAPCLPALKRRLADVTVPNKDAVELAMSSERLIKRNATESNRRSGWPTLTPDELQTLFKNGQGTLLRRLKSQAIANEKITSKGYRISPNSLPEGWQRMLKRD